MTQPRPTPHRGRDGPYLSGTRCRLRHRRPITDQTLIEVKTATQPETLLCRSTRASSGDPGIWSPWPSRTTSTPTGQSGSATPVAAVPRRNCRAARRARPGPVHAGVLGENQHPDQDPARVRKKPSPSSTRSSRPPRVSADQRKHARDKASRQRGAQLGHGFPPAAKRVSHRRQYASGAICGGPRIRQKPADRKSVV